MILPGNLNYRSYITPLGVAMICDIDIPFCIKPNCDGCIFINIVHDAPNGLINPACSVIFKDMTVMRKKHGWKVGILFNRNDVLCELWETVCSSGLSAMLSVNIICGWECP